MQIHSQISVDRQARRIWTNCQEKRNKHSREFSARASVDAALHSLLHIFKRFCKNENATSVTQSVTYPRIQLSYDMT